jgi:hypothetical protein
LPELQPPDHGHVPFSFEALPAIRPKRGFHPVMLLDLMLRHLEGDLL